LDDERKGVRNSTESNLTLRCRFEIDEHNWRNLTILSDKYIIDSLRKDLRVIIISHLR